MTMGSPHEGKPFQMQRNLRARVGDLVDFGYISNKIWTSGHQVVATRDIRLEKERWECC
jgi:hypothetical protein